MELSINTQADKAVALASAVYETVAEAGDEGAPGGHIYAALMTAGIDFEEFEAPMRVLVGSKLLRKQGDCYFCTAAR